MGVQLRQPCLKINWERLRGSPVAEPLPVCGVHTWLPLQRPTEEPGHPWEAPDKPIEREGTGVSLGVLTHVDPSVRMCVCGQGVGVSATPAPLLCFRVVTQFLQPAPLLDFLFCTLLL